MSSKDETETLPKGGMRSRIIEMAQAQMHEARQMYRSGEISSPEMKAAIDEYYDALRPLRNEHVVEKFWQEARLWPIRRQLEDAVGCFECAPRQDDFVPRDGEPGDTCPGCGAILELAQVPAYDDDGNELWEWQTGLDHIPDYEIETVVEYETIEKLSGIQRIEHEIEIPAVREKLLRFSNLLDDAAAEAGFQPAMPDSVPRTEITDELMQEVEKWRRKHNQD